MKVVQQYKLNYLSIVKGVAIFLMLWGHCIQCCTNDRFDFFEDNVFKFIYSFHMPLFMLISGYLFYYSFSKRNLSELLRHRIQGLLQPIVMVTFINYYLTTGIINLYPPRKMNVLISGAWLDEIDSLWFLWSILVSVIIIGVTFKLTTTVIKQICLLFLGLPLLLIMPCAILNVYMFPYFLVGFMICKVKEENGGTFGKIIKYKYLALIIFPIMLFFFRKKHYIYTSGLFSFDYSPIEYLAIDVYRWAIGFAGSLFVLALLEIIYKYTQNIKAVYWICFQFDRIGAKSLQYYCISVLVLSSYLQWIFSLVTNKMGIEYLPDYRILYDFVITPLIAIAYVLLIKLIIKVLEKTKLSRLIFGR